MKTHVLVFIFLISFFQNNVLAQTTFEAVIEEILRAPIITIPPKDSIAVIDLNKGIILISNPLTCKPCIIEMATHFDIPIIFLLNENLSGARAWSNYLKSNDLKNQCYFVVYENGIAVDSPILIYSRKNEIYYESYESIFNTRPKKKKIKELKKLLNTIQ